MIDKVALIFAMLCVLSGHLISQTCTPLPSDAVAWWRANAGELGVDALNGLNASTLGRAREAPGMVGGGIDLTSTAGSAMSVPASPLMNIDTSPTTRGFSVEMWVRVDAFTPGQLYNALNKNHSGGGGWTFQSNWSSPTTLSFIVCHDIPLPGSNGCVGAASAPLTPGVWYHLVGTWHPSSGVSVYTNGTHTVSKHHTNPLAKPAASPGGLEFGSWNGSRKLNGAVDEVTIYQRALTAPEISALYAAGSAGKCSPVEGDYTIGGGFPQGDFHLLYIDYDPFDLTDPKWSTPFDLVHVLTPLSPVEFDFLANGAQNHILYETKASGDWDVWTQNDPPTAGPIRVSVKIDSSINLFVQRSLWLRFRTPIGEDSEVRLTTTYDGMGPLIAEPVDLHIPATR